jgi:hypothetical protein
MNRQTHRFVSFSSALRAAVAGAVCVGAVFALAGLPGFRPALEPEGQAATPRIEIRAAPSAALTVQSYYPEQLAALQSLNAFKPIADAGVKPEAPPVALAVAVAAKSAGLEVRPVRRPDSPVKLAAAAPPKAPAPAPEAQKPIGAPLAGAEEIGGRLAGLRDTAANWGQAALGMGGAAAASLGGKIASLWR